MPKQPRNTPLRSQISIVDGILYFEDVRQAEIDTELFTEIISHRSCISIRLVSLASGWKTREYIAGVGAMSFDLKIEMTLRCEIRSQTRYWYAYRRVGGKLCKRFVGQDDRVTTKRLLEIAQHLG